MDDPELLNHFIQHLDQRAFAQLVERYVDVVWASARRQLRDAHAADDVTQAVFILLAQKAESIRDGESSGRLADQRHALVCALISSRAGAAQEARGRGGYHEQQDRIAAAAR